MREHKYLAWNRELKSMWWFDITWGNFQQGDGWVGMLPIGETNKRNKMQIDPDNCEFLEFTGSKDKNSNDIYEDFIVKDDGGNIGRVIWNQSECGFDIDFPDIELQSLGENADYVKIIGNIYQNPDLIKTP